MRTQDVERFTHAQINRAWARTAALEAEEELERIRRQNAAESDALGSPEERFDTVWNQLLTLLHDRPVGPHIISGNTDIRIVECVIDNVPAYFGIYFNIHGNRRVDPVSRRVEARWLRYNEFSPDPSDFNEWVSRDALFDSEGRDLKVMADLGSIELTLKAYLESNRVQGFNPHDQKI